MRRIAMLSMHTSPLVQPGVGDGGGMNVYVRELVSALANQGVACTTFTRRWRRDLPEVVEVEPNHRVVHVDAGDPALRKELLAGTVDRFADGVAAFLARDGGTDVLHANYWLSGLAGHRLKHELNLPLVTTFHTFARVKSQGGDLESHEREQAELEVIGCADAICVSCPEERDEFESLYGRAPGTIQVVSPGVERALFSPGDQRGARTALRLGEGSILLFVGRIQPLKGLDVAVEALAARGMESARLVLVGGASGEQGDGEFARIRALVDRLGLCGRVEFHPPQPHHVLSTYYRAADVVLVPSRSESFGLVALEAAACGVPVVATAVGGLATIVDHGRTGLLVRDRSPESFARAARSLLDDPLRALQMGTAAAHRAARFTWAEAARSASDLYRGVQASRLVACAG